MVRPSRLHESCVPTLVQARRPHHNVPALGALPPRVYAPAMPAPAAPPTDPAPPADPASAAAPSPAPADVRADPADARFFGVDLKNRVVAGLLAAAVPGLGHVYQGRHVKGAIYSVGILGLFLCGQAMGGWQTVGLESDAPGVPVGTDLYDGPGDDPFRAPFGPPRRQLLQHYTAQAFAGAAAWPALVQGRRFYRPDNVPTRTLPGPLEASFAGAVVADYGDRSVVLAGVTGTASLTPRGDGSRVEGELAVTAAPPADPRRRTGWEGTAVTAPADPAPRNVSLSPVNVRAFDRPVNGEPGRLLKLTLDPADVTKLALPGGVDAGDLARPRVIGTVPRPLLDWYLAPRDRRAANRLHAEKGTEMDLAVIFTMLAGLLNILAFWDAVEGPAYGLTDADPDGDDLEGSKTPGAAPVPA